MMVLPYNITMADIKRKMEIEAGLEMKPCSHPSELRRELRLQQWGLQ